MLFRCTSHDHWRGGNRKPQSDCRLNIMGIQIRTFLKETAVVAWGLVDMNPPIAKNCAREIPSIGSTAENRRFGKR